MTTTPGDGPQPTPDPSYPVQPGGVRLDTPDGTLHPIQVRYDGTSGPNHTHVWTAVFGDLVVPADATATWFLRVDQLPAWTSVAVEFTRTTTEKRP